jgi:hypothetical protein
LLFLRAYIDYTQPLRATTDALPAMSASQTNSWLRQQRKMDLVEIAENVGLKEYVYFSSIFLPGMSCAGGASGSRRPALSGPCP